MRSFATLTMRQIKQMSINGSKGTGWCCAVVGVTIFEDISFEIVQKTAAEKPLFAQTSFQTNVYVCALCVCS